MRKHFALVLFGWFLLAGLLGSPAGMVTAQVKVGTPETVVKPDAAGTKVSSDPSATVGQQPAVHPAVPGPVPPATASGSSEDGPLLVVPTGGNLGEYLVSTGLPAMRDAFLAAMNDGDLSSLSRLFAQPNLLLESQTLIDGGVVNGLQNGDLFFIESFANNGNDAIIGLQNKPGLKFVLSPVGGGYAITQIQLP